MSRLLWRKRSMRMHVNEVAFRGDSSLPMILKQKLQTPMEYFNYFFSNDIVELITNETNRCALQHDINTKFKTNETEIRLYIGILIYMSLYRYPNIESYCVKSV